MHNQFCDSSWPGGFLQRLSMLQCSLYAAPAHAEQSKHQICGLPVTTLGTVCRSRARMGTQPCTKLPSAAMRSCSSPSCAWELTDSPATRWKACALSACCQVTPMLPCAPCSHVRSIDCKHTRIRSISARHASALHWVDVSPSTMQMYKEQHMPCLTCPKCSDCGSEQHVADIRAASVLVRCRGGLPRAACALHGKFSAVIEQHGGHMGVWSRTARPRPRLRPSTITRRQLG